MKHFVMKEDLIRERCYFFYSYGDFIYFKVFNFAGWCRMVVMYCPLILAIFKNKLKSEISLNLMIRLYDNRLQNEKIIALLFNIIRLFL